MVAELEDRYGHLQPPVENLLLVMRLRQLAREKEVEAIEQQKNVIAIKFSKEKKFHSEQLWQVVSKNRRCLSLLSGKGITLKVKVSHEVEKDYLRYLIKILEQVD